MCLLQYLSIKKLSGKTKYQTAPYSGSAERETSLSVYTVDIWSSCRLTVTEVALSWCCHISANECSLYADHPCTGVWPNNVECNKRPFPATNANIAVFASLAVSQTVDYAANTQLIWSLIIISVHFLHVLYFSAFFFFFFYLFAFTVFFCE